DARRQVSNAAEEVLRIGKFFFNAKNCAHRADGNPQVRSFVFAVRDLRAPGVAAEVVADQRADKALGARRRRRREQEKNTGKENIPRMVGMHRSPRWSGEKPSALP